MRPAFGLEHFDGERRMVALHNGRLTDSDLFRGVLWDDKMWHAKRDELRRELMAQGLEDPHLFFETSRAMERYQQAQPSMKERQQIRARLFPAKVIPRFDLTDDEMVYLYERLQGVNDETGQSIRDKLALVLTSKDLLPD
jgi:hypothetical protein